eukprot:COSAG01_NODE_3193_length_6435_cov_5.956597_3_plen_113_part_00
MQEVLVRHLARLARGASEPPSWAKMVRATSGVHSGSADDDGGEVVHAGGAERGRQVEAWGKQPPHSCARARAMHIVCLMPDTQLCSAASSTAQCGIRSSATHRTVTALGVVR